MSWSLSFQRPVKKSEVDAAITALKLEGYNFEPDVLASVEGQIEVAKSVAKQIVSAVAGPYIQVSLNGHANATGENPKPGWANDYISVSVTQCFEEDLKIWL